MRGRARDAARLRELFVAGEHPERRFPAITAHLEACGPCGEDFAGLVPRSAAPELTIHAAPAALCSVHPKPVIRDRVSTAAG